MTRRVLDLFSGIGGFALGLHEARAGFITARMVEIESFCRRVLAARFPGVPVHDDVRTLSGARGEYELVVGGFPCQPHSVAGKRAGKADDRHLWPEFARLVAEIRPRWVIAENVPGIRTTAADDVLGDLEALGYACGAWVVGADDVGAPHRRKRVWFVAHAGREHDERRRCGPGGAQAPGPRDLAGRPSARCDVGDAQRAGLAFREGFGRHLLRELEAAERAGRASLWPRWGAEPGLGGAADGLPTGMDERGAGEGIEPQQAQSGLHQAEHGLTWPTPSASLGTHAGLVSEAKGREGGTLVEAVSARMWPTPHGHGDDGHGSELSQAMRVAEGSSDSARSAAKVGAWQVEPWERGIPRVVPRGAPNRTSRLKALGNAVVPQVVTAIGRAIAAYEADDLL